jgi:type IV pilus assembly protein PilM
MRIPSPNIKLDFKLGRRTGANVVGLDIQPGFVAAVQTRVNGSVLAERAAALPLAGDTMRDGEVADDEALSDVLRELFRTSGLSKHVRVGVANQRTVLRTIELPPVTDRKELAAAVSFQAQDQVPMPLSNAVLDFHPLGIIDTPAGPRQRVVLVAAQRDMVERLLSAVRHAGLTPEGIDLSAFALIRALYQPDPDQTARVLYLNVDGLTNLAIAEGTVCRFTRVVGSGLEGIASELAVRRGIPLAEARSLLASVDMTIPAELQAGAPPAAPEQAAPEEHAEPEQAALESPSGEEQAGEEHAPGGDAPEQSSAEQAHELHEADEAGMSFAELAAIPAPAPTPAPAPESEPAPGEQSVADVLEVLENGVREISGEVRNSLDFHRSQDGGGEVSHVVLSGAAQDMPGFAEALQSSLGVEVRSMTVGLVDKSLAGTVSTHRLAVAAGLGISEAPR